MIVSCRYVGLGSKRSLHVLTKAYADRSFFMPLLKADPELDPLRSDPRFAELSGKTPTPTSQF
jgi:hypothetical protein